MPLGSLGDLVFQCGQLLMDGLQINFLFRCCCTDIPADIEVVVIVRNLGHGYAAGITLFFPAKLVGLNDLVDIFRA